MFPFELLAMNFDPAPIMREIDEANAWNQSARVTFKNSPQRDTQDIILRGPIGWESDDLLTLHQQIECEDYAAMHLHIETRELVGEIFVVVEGVKLGRVILAKLPPGKVVYPHADEGLVPETYLRYHAIVQSGYGSWFLVNNHALHMQPTQIYQVNVRKQHAVVNLSDEDRIHLIVDILS